VTGAPHPIDAHDLVAGQATLSRAADRSIAALERLAATDPNVFASVVLRDETNGAPVVQGPQHVLWQHIWKTFDRSVLLAYTGGGKCEAAGARLLLASGEHTPIEQLSGGVHDVVLLDPSSAELRTARAAVTPNGTKRVWRIRLRTGRELRLTDEHPVYLPTGWTRAKNVRAGDSLATARTIPEPSTLSGVPEEEAALLGYIAGDGGATRPSRCGFTNADPDIIEDVARLGALRGWGLSSTHPPYGFTLARANGVGGWPPGAESPASWLRRHDLAHGAHQKRVPSAVFRSSNAAVGAFVGAYFACDGHVHDKMTLELSSVSRGLLEDVQLLLLRLGVVGSIRPHSHPKFPSWRLYVTGEEAVHRFAAACRVVGPKRAQLDTLLQQTSGKNAYSVKDTVPKEWRSLYHRQVGNSDAVYYGVNPTAEGNHRTAVRRLLSGVRKDGTPDTRFEPNSAHNHAVALLADDAFYWDRVVAVEELPEEPTWAVEVFDDAHCYLSSGVLSHNTQQAIAHVLHKLGQNPSLRIGVLCSTITRARKIVKQIGQYIQDSEALHRVFPNLRHRTRNWSDFAFTVVRPTIAKDPTVQAIGLHTGILGARIDLLLMDDVVDYENSRTESLRKTTIEWVKSTIFGRFAKDTHVMAIGNAYHPEDLMHHLGKLPGWAAFKFPVLDGAGNTVWEHMFPMSRIERKRQELGELEFARQMMCVARTDTESRFNSAWITAAKTAGDTLTLVPTYQPTSAEIVITGVDIGVQQHAKADKTVLFTIALHKSGKRTVLNIESGRWAADEIIRRCADHHKRYAATIVVENNGAQDFLQQFLKLSHQNVPVKTHTTGRNKTHPVLGVEGMAIEFSRGEWVIPSKHKSKEIDAWVQDMLYFDPSTHLGDHLAASWIARSYALRVTKSTAQPLNLHLMSR